MTIQNTPKNTSQEPPINYATKEQKPTNSKLFLVLSIFAFLVSLISLGFALSSYITTSTTAPEKRNSDFAQMESYSEVQIVDYIELENGIEEYEEKIGGIRRITQTWLYALVYTSENEFVIAEMREDEKIEIGSAIVKIHSENKTEITLLNKIKEEAKLYEETVPDDVVFVEMSNLDDYKNDWISGTIFGIITLTISITLFFATKIFRVNKPKKEQM